VGVDSSSLQADSRPKSLGLSVSGRLALFCIRHMNWVNSRNDYAIITARVNIVTELLDASLNTVRDYIAIDRVVSPSRDVVDWLVTFVVKQCVVG